MLRCVAYVIITAVYDFLLIEAFSEMNICIFLKIYLIGV